MSKAFFAKAEIEPIVKVEKARRTLPSETADLISDIVDPPVSWEDILNLTNANAYHTACIAVKAGVTVGLGFDAPNGVINWFNDSTPEDTPLSLLHKIAIDLETFGNAYLEIGYNAEGQPVELYHVPAQTVYVRLKSKTRYSLVQFHATGFTEFPLFSPEKPLVQSSALMHFKFHTPLSFFYGLPEWLAALEALRMDRNIKLFHSAFFQNNAMPSMAVILEGGEFTDEVAQAIKNALQLTKGVENAHRVLVLDVPFENASVKFEKLLADQKDFSFKELYKATREEIIAAHQVPPRLLGIVTPGQLGGGGEAEAQMRIFKDITIKRRQRYIESQIKKLLQAAGLPPQFTLKTFDSPEYSETSESSGETSLEVLKAIEAKLI